MNRFLILLTAVLTFAFSSCSKKECSVNIYATNDIHGSYFSEPLKEGEPSLLSLSNVSSYMKGQRAENGDDVILLDLGDNLQGSNAAYFFNYKDSVSQEHFLVRAFDFLDYDAVIVGNHDIETGHKIYDKIDKDLKIPYLAANAIDMRTDKPYFQPYTIIERDGAHIAVIGMENPNIHKWLTPGLWSGIIFMPIYEMIDSTISYVRREENPDIVILAMHAGIGSEDKYDVEDPALYIASRVKGIDAIFAAHDHKVFLDKVYNGQDSVLVIEAGSKCQFLSKVNISFKKEKGVVYDKKITASIVDMSSVPSDPEYDKAFKADFERVKSFTNIKIGYLAKDINMEDALYGMSDYLNLIHLAQLEASKANISISAPLTTDVYLKKGDILFQDLFKFYRFENQLYVLNMTGTELKEYLEASYDSWVTGNGPSFNYDSAAGLIYTVSRSAKKGKRVKIKSMADGSPFKPGKIYTVAMTSYRASGAGDLLAAANITSSELESRVIKRFPEIRDFLYQYILEIGTVDPDTLLKDPKLGYWNFAK